MVKNTIYYSLDGLETSLVELVEAISDINIEKKTKIAYPKGKGRIWQE